MKKRFILFMLLPAISLTANTDSFYKRIHALQNHSGNSFSHQSRTVVNPNLPRKVYRYRNSHLQPRRQMVIHQPMVHTHIKRTQRVSVSAIDSQKFFYAMRAAKNNNAKAQFDLAIMYATGRGTQKNEKLAFNWFHKSARQNYAAAKHYMGLSFLQGRGVRKQQELARYWFKLALKQGYQSSAIYLEQIDSRA